MAQIELSKAQQDLAKEYRALATEDKTALVKYLKKYPQFMELEDESIRKLLLGQRKASLLLVALSKGFIEERSKAIPVQKTKNQTSFL